MKNWKRIILTLLVVLLLPVLAGCKKGSSSLELETKNEIEEASIEKLIASTNSTISTLLQTYTFDEFKQYNEMGQLYGSIPFNESIRTRWGDFVELHGEVTKAECKEAEKTEDGYVSHVVLTGSDNQMMRLNVSFDETLAPLSTTLEPYADDTNKTTGDKMAEAGMNTLIGIGVVFSVLILLTLVISAMKYVNVFGEKKEKAAKVEETAQAAAAPVTKAAPVVAEASDDGSLVVVIAAAIAAFENTSQDSFTVRSIRRVNRR